MARFLPYDQTGFARLDPSVNRRPFAAAAQWMKPSELAKPKDWDSPAGLQSALQLSKALIEHPLTDLAVKGVGELVGLTKDPATKPKEKAAYDSLADQIADAKARMEAMGERPADLVQKQAAQGPVSMSMTEDQLMGRSSPQETPEQRKALQGEYDADQQKLAHELVGLERQQEKIDFTIDNEDELYAFAVQNPDHVEWAMGQVSRVAPAPTLSELRTGKTPAARIRKNLLDLSKRTLLTPAQELVHKRHQERMLWSKEKEERRVFERNRRWDRVLKQDKEGVKLTLLKEDKLRKQLELLDRRIQENPERKREFIRAFAQIVKARYPTPEIQEAKLKQLTDLFSGLYPEDRGYWKNAFEAGGKLDPAKAPPSAAVKRKRGEARRAARSGNVMEQIQKFNEQRVTLEREYGALSAEEKSRRYVEFDERFKGLLAGYKELQTSQKPGKKEGRRGRVATLDPKINDALRKGVMAVNTWRRATEQNRSERAKAAEMAKKEAAAEAKAKQAAEKKRKEAEAATAATKKAATRKVNTAKAQLITALQEALGGGMGEVGPVVNTGGVELSRDAGVINAERALLAITNKTFAKGVVDKHAAYRARIKNALAKLRKVYGENYHLYDLTTY
jgi:hypothetical protein